MKNETGRPPMELAFHAADLMARYAAALDEGELEAWAEMFVDGASYTVASAENVRERWPLLLINDDGPGRIRDRVEANHKAAFEWEDSLVEAVLQRCTEVDSGARNVDHILNGTLLPEIAESVLAKMAEGERITKIKVGADKKGAFKYRIH